ncbi:hypothetical protein [Leptolyngbya sp. BC1307]|uniref:hypothetical protein n=1 Tax=Leptolyngbya sp. BC1307 TaxID=2029589 RepID=UPI000EFD307F|nr:hypothetical protein [Leptolyngbya sp. BC1307]
MQSDDGKLLLIDAICEEWLQGTRRLKILKGAYLDGENVCGNVNYLIAERCVYLVNPFGCVIQANNDDFERGEAQCLVVMQTCQWASQQSGKATNIYGAVTDGKWWNFID